MNEQKDKRNRMMNKDTKIGHQEQILSDNAAGLANQSSACTSQEEAPKHVHRTLGDWIVASRPWSFPASLMPVVAISAWMFWCTGTQGWVGLDWTCALLSLVMMVLMQAAGNLIGDYYDHVRGIDLPGSLNGVRHIQSGKFLPREILRYGYACLSVSLLLGLAILSRCGVQGLWLGVAAVLLVVCYPWLKAHALGDLDILLGYALLPALGVAFAVTGQWMWQPMVLVLPVGLLTVSILHANNTRDILNDSRAGILTLSICLGGRAAQWVYVVENAAAYLMLPLLCACGMLPWTCMLAWVTLPLALRNVGVMLHAQPLAEEPIATLDQRTAQTQLAFSMAYAAAFPLSFMMGW